MDMNFYMPTKVILGAECIRNNISLLEGFGTKALIVTGTTSAKRNGSLNDIIEALSMLGKTYVVFDKVMSNPTIACVYEGAALAKESKVDFVIGIGGGSPMDAAKAIALLAVQDVKEEELFLGKFEDRVLPLIMIPTTAGTGSEVTPYAILTNDKAQTKTSLATPLIYPRISFLDARYMKNLSMTITKNTAMDALSHSIEGMLSVRSSILTDSLAIESIKEIAQCLSYLYEENGSENGDFVSLSMEYREKLLYASMLAGIVIAHTGTTAVHSMGYCLTYFKNIDHGRANALLLPTFLRFVAKKDQEVIKKILSAMGLDTLDEFEMLFLKLLEDQEFATIDEIEKYSDIAINAKNILNSRVIPTKDDLIVIYYRSLA